MLTGIVLLAIALAVSIVAHVAFDVSLGIVLLVFLVGGALVGAMVTIDDDLPGGWSNPDGSVRAPWLQAPFWGQISAGLAISAVGFAIDTGWRSARGAQCWLLAVAGGFLAVGLITRRWWLLVGCALGVVAAFVVAAT